MTAGLRVLHTPVTSATSLPEKGHAAHRVGQDGGLVRESPEGAGGEVLGARPTQNWGEKKDLLAHPSWSASLSFVFPILQMGKERQPGPILRDPGPTL